MASNVTPSIPGAPLLFFAISVGNSQRSLAYRRERYSPQNRHDVISLRLDVDSPSQILQTQWTPLSFHPCLSCVVRRNANSRVPWLRGRYSHPSYYAPIHHPLAFDPLPGVVGYRVYLAPAISHWDEEGFSSCFACPCHRAVADHPAGVVSRISQIAPVPCCLRPTG